MDTLNFLQRVLPSAGIYVTAIINNDGSRRQGYFETVEELAKAVEQLDQANNNTYFAIASFMQKGNRKQDNVRSLKCIAMDIDCGAEKPYPTWKHGLVALDKFIKDTGLPMPMVVHSGNGLHTYWTFESEVDPADWKPVADLVKAVALAMEFHLDPAVTGDSARILRPVGTRNHKNGNVVKLLIDKPNTTLDAIRAALAPHQSKLNLPLPMAHPVSYQRSASSSKLLDALAVRQDSAPAVSAVVEAKCQQIAWAVKNADQVPEPLWYTLIGVAAYCQEPEETAIRWSAGHPTFDETTTINKLNQWMSSTTGPATCSKFLMDRPSGCKGCKFSGKITTPAQLGKQYTEVAVSTEAPDQIAFAVPLPKPFKRADSGIKITVDDTDIDICPFDLYPVGYGKDESLGYETVRYHWKRPHIGWTELAFRQAFLTDGSREFAGAIADQGIVLTSKKQTEYFQLMLRSYMEQLRQQRAMTNLYSTMGWKEDFTQFVLGDTILRRNADGTVSEEVVTLSSGTQRLGQELYTKAGDMATWTELTSVFEKAHLPWHMFGLGVGLSSPLYAFTGLKGITVSLYGPSGGGKTLLQYFIQSIYGNPEKLHFTARFTQSSVYSRLGFYCHTPFTIDEATMMSAKDVGELCYSVTQGRDKARLNRNAEERAAKEWAAPVILSTNKSIQALLFSAGMETDAQLARLLELNVPPHKMFSKDSSAGRRIYGLLMANHGHVGKVFVTKLLELGPDAVKAMIETHVVNFQEQYNCQFSGVERYWEQAIILADLAQKLALEWGLINYDYTKATIWKLEELGAIRTAIANNRMDSFDIISSFLNDHASSIVTVMHTNGQPQPLLDYERVPRSDIRARFDVYRKSAAEPFSGGTLMLERTKLREWMAERGIDYKSFINELTTESVVATPASNKFSLGKHTPIKIGQMYVVGVNLNHPKLIGMLSNVDEEVDNLAYGELRAVS
jgi:hypothetical protein